MQNAFLTRRAQMAFVGIGLWFFLALWSLSAFWEHIEQLGVKYPAATKAGAMAGELAILALILWHCFDKHIGVRRWSLIFAVVLSGAMLVHAGALRGMAEAQTAQIEAEKRLKETLTEMSKAQMGSASGRFKSRTQQEIAIKAQEELAATVKAGADKIKDSSILPRWYLDGWMYSLLFILSLISVGIVSMLMMGNDVDANFNGVVDSQETEFPKSIYVGKSQDHP